MKLLVVLALVASALAPAPASCAVADAELNWGFKESFRSYISGTIANGEWTVANGAEYDTPDFGFNAGVGSYERGTGTIDFVGSITFTGHDGILTTTVANPQLRLEGYSAVLVLDVTGTAQEGAVVDETSVDFARLDLSNALHADENGTVTVTAAPAVLTADGAAAFGTYLEGEALDPVTLTFTTAQDCASMPPPVWPIALAIVLAAALMAATVLVVRRLRARRAVPRQASANK